MFHIHPHGHHQVLFAIIVAVAFLCSWLTIADLQEADRRIAQAILDSLAAVRMTHKIACDLMGYTKGQWSKVLSCELHISLTRLRRLGLPFNAEYMPRYLHIVADDHAQQIVVSARERGQASAA